MPFDPAQLTPAASLNRVLLADGPAPLRPAFELLSARALHGLILSREAELGLPETPPSAETLLVAFDACLDASRPAQEIAGTFVRRLAALVITLKTGAPEARTARPEWDESYWQAWADVTTIRLGGGLLSGALGRFVDLRLPELLGGAGLEVDVRVSAHSRSLPLIGAARSRMAPASRAAALDFGHTAVKRAAAFYASNRLDRLQLLDPVPATLLAQAASASEVEELGRQLAALIAKTWLEVKSSGGDASISTEILCSMACYLKDGQPYPQASGTHAALQALSPNLAGWLSQRVSKLAGTPIKVRLLHDGTAASRAYPETEDLAVILCGTALGVGFASSGEELLDLSPGFAVR